VCREQCDTIIKFLGTNHTSLFLTKYSKYLTFQCFDITNIKQSTYEMAQKYCSKAKHKSNFLSDICLKTLLIFSITKSKKNINAPKVSSSYAESIPSSASRQRQKEDKYSLTPLKTILGVYIRPSVEAWASLWSAAVATAEILC